MNTQKILQLIIIGSFLFSCNTSDEPESLESIANESNYTSEIDKTNIINSILSVNNNNLPDYVDLNRRSAEAIENPYCVTTQLGVEMDTRNLYFSRDNFGSIINRLYHLRDNLLSKTSRGRGYIDSFYEISELIRDHESFSLNELVSIASILPELVSKYNDFNDVNYTGVIIDNTLKNKIVSISDIYRSKNTLNNTRYHQLIDALVRDIDELANKNSFQIKLYLAN